jgi:hypothetical protein
MMKLLEKEEKEEDESEDIVYIKSVYDPMDATTIKKALYQINKEKKSGKVIIFNTNSLNEILIELYKINNKLCKHKAYGSKGNVTQILHESVKLMVDPNYGSTSSGITFEDIQKVCKTFAIPFKNQSFSQLVMEIAKNVKKPQRVRIEEKVVEEILKGQDFKCKVCECMLVEKHDGYEDLKYEIDHIIPLACNGTSDINNLQALCKECHFDKTTSEKDNGDYLAYSEITSTYHPTIEDIVKSEQSKRYAFIENIVDDISTDKIIHSIDINKERKNNLYYTKEKFNVFTCMDKPEVYLPSEESKVQAGIYYVVSDNYMPLRKNGWYSHTMVNYCLRKKIITQENIIYAVKSSLYVKADYFRPVIDKFMELPTEKGMQKLATNVYIGCLNKTELKVTKHYYYTNLDAAFAKADKVGGSIGKANDMCVHVGVFHEDDEKKIYNVAETSFSELDVTNSIIYQQIMDLEAIELHKLKSLVEKNNGHVVAYNTDCIKCWFDNDKPMDIFDYFWDDEKTVRKYKYEGYQYYFRDTEEAKYRHLTVTGKFNQQNITKKWFNSFFNNKDKDHKKKYNNIESKMLDGSIALMSHEENEKCLLMKYERMENLIRGDVSEALYDDLFKESQNGWNITVDPQTNDFNKLADDIIASNQSINIDGIAGAGKTSLIRLLIKKNAKIEKAKPIKIRK